MWNKLVKRPKYTTYKYKWDKTKLLERIIEYIKVDKRCSVYIYKANEKNKNKLKKAK